MQQFDIAVIGAGSGGLTAAVGLAKIGKRVLLIERDHIGGECTNSGCIPSKALLHHARAYAEAVTVTGTNDRTESFRRNAFAYVQAKIDEILTTETTEHFTALGITVMYGEAVFTGPRSLSVENNHYTFSRAVIATGSSPRLITIPGLQPEDTLTNQNLFRIGEVPERMLVVGGGPIGLEMGQAFALLGSQVTIVDTGATLATLEDPSVSAVLQHSFASCGITFIGNATVSNVDNKSAVITIKDTGTPTIVPFDTVLMAVGRTPNVPKSLPVAGVTASDFGITVNAQYQTSNTRIYALGDVADRYKFTHQADDVARQVVAHIATKGFAKARTKALPKVTYTSPELAQVGLSRTLAVDMYGEHYIHRIVVPFSMNDRARTEGATNGVLVVLVKRLSGKILGAHIAGERAGELIAPFTLAIDNNLSLWKLRRSIYAYPTYSLCIKKAGDLFFAAEVATLKENLWRVIRRALPYCFVLTLWVASLFMLYYYQRTNNLSTQGTIVLLFDLITVSSVGPLLYILAYTARPLTFIPGTIMTILSGVFFGLGEGIFYTVIGANLSALFAYAIGRYFGGTRVPTPIGIFGRFAETCRTHPFTSVLTMRFLFLPFDGVNYGSGYMRIPPLPYILGTFVGTFLGIVTFVAIGASISINEFKEHGISVQVIDSTYLALSAGIFIISLVIARLLKK